MVNDETSMVALVRERPFDFLTRYCTFFFDANLHPKNGCLPHVRKRNCAVKITNRTAVDGGTHKPACGSSNGPRPIHGQDSPTAYILVGNGERFLSNHMQEPVVSVASKTLCALT